MLSQSRVLHYNKQLQVIVMAAAEHLRIHLTPESWEQVVYELQELRASTTGKMLGGSEPTANGNETKDENKTRRRE